MAEERSIRDAMAAEFRKVAPGTRLREALDMLISARSGALIVIGDPNALVPLCTGGFVIDMAFTPQRLFELSKMDGAIILDAECARIIAANVHLVPDASLPTSETGMRHRAAEQVSRQTESLVLAISQRRNVVNMYLRGYRSTLQDIDMLLAKANQAIQTLQNYRHRLDEELERLTLLEFEDLVTLGDVSAVISRFEMLQRVAREVARYILQLGTEGRLVKMQSDELTAGVAEGYALVVRDYADDPSIKRAARVRERLAELPPEELLQPEAIGAALGITVSEQAEEHVRPRGFRALEQIPALPANVVGRIIERFGSLKGILHASEDDLDAVDGVGERRAKAITRGLARVRAHVAV